MDSEQLQEPGTEQLQQPEGQQLQEPGAGQLQEPVAGQLQEPDGGRLQESVAGQLQEPVAEQLQEPVAERLQEPVAERLQGPPVAGSEVDTLLGALERNRRTFAWKCGGLDAAGLRKQHAPSTMTLGGLLKHVALVEDEYFTGRLHDRELPAPWDTVDWDTHPDWEWESAAADSPEELMDLWKASVERSRKAVAEALATAGMDQLAKRTGRGGEAPSLRYILVDLIEEYARHTGHADLIRESIDGLVGEGAPHEELPA